ncbi:DUF3037 domain-containing protein [Mucilaginibacter sp. KACC 22063]|uniref:DUF3037 domain-containing protein n=1 Tax=Mucilaginibacter sp. KACC 22063 TaxID=3025666 RepID=UPI002366A00B|nr:DUF3037 domain-containing protein [Mucilaginibacter sp. KACC 22063]WDF56935.1 DUF3037 domain-containing protein [Mucilaginibacter sp. KACC 22063]
MQEKHLFEYAVIRVVPRVEREEFINVGVILYCKQEKFLQIKCAIKADRLLALCPDIDIDELKCHMDALQQICQGTQAGGPIAKLDAPSRFRWITATRSTVVQASKVHPGLCISASETLEKLYEQLVD